jgi:hypothetical protein
MAAERYYVGKGERAKGPYTIDQLRAAVRESALSEATRVYAEGEAEARPLGELLRAKAPPREAPRLFGEEEDPLRRVFCETCYAESSPGAPKDLVSINGFGTTLFGHAERCPRCGSEVRVHWVVLAAFPVLPLATYRVRHVSSGFMSTKFLARRTHTRWGQILVHWAVAVGLWVALIGSIILFVALSRR